MRNFFQSIREHATPAQLCALGAAWALPFLLLALVPYSKGYGGVPVPAFQQVLNIGLQSEDWQHCLVVLPLAVALSLQALSRNPLPLGGGGWAGFAVFAFSGLLFWTGVKMDTHYVGFFAFQGMVAGAVWFFLGWRALLFFAFPILFVAFAWPMPFLDNIIAFPLRMAMSAASVFVLDAIGIDVVRSGTGILSAPDPLLGIAAGQKFAVDVADPCSGIRSLFALMMVSALYAQFTLKTWWQKWALFACSAPLAILGNLARILMLTIGTIVFGAEFAIGKNALTDPSWFHMLAGYLVFIVALGGMVGIGALLTNGPGIAAAAREKLNPPAPAPRQEAPRGEKREDEY